MKLTKFALLTTFFIILFSFSSKQILASETNLGCGEYTLDLGKNTDVHCLCNKQTTVEKFRRAYNGDDLICCGAVQNNTCINPNTKDETNDNAKLHAKCGNSYEGVSIRDQYVCDCSSGWTSLSINGSSETCCGWDYDNQCSATSEYYSPSDDITTGLTNDTFNDLNPLKIGGSDVELNSPGAVISRVLTFLFPLAGLALFALISWGGFEMLISATDQKGMEAGKNRVTAAVIGFILLFSSYWLAQIMEFVFKIKIL